jgi:HlyD family secretion protein
MTARKSRAWLKWLVFLLIVGGGIAGWRWYAQQPKDAAVDYKTAPVGRGDITQAVTANGPISPVKSVTVGSQVSGIIVDLKADFNSRVTNGQIIAQIDPSTYQQMITQTEADLANAKAGLELADLNYRRSKELRAKDLIPQSDYDKSVVDLHQAEAVVKMREAVVNKAKVDLERTTIYSPIDGVVISRAVDVGQTVAASFNAPTLFYLANDLRNMRIEAMVSEADVGGVQEGQPVTFTVDAYQGRQFRGEVTQVRFAPITNQNVVNYVSIVNVNNDDLKLRPGMTANASIITAQRRDVLRIPSAALRFRPSEKAAISGGTNAPAAGNVGTNRNLAAVQGPGDSGSPGGGGERPGREEMRKRMENMSPEEREQFRARMRGRFGDGPGGQGFGGGRRGDGGGSDGPMTRTVYLFEKEVAGGKEQTVLKPVVVKLGISDGTYTEVLDGLKEGDVVVTGLNLPAPATATATTTRPGGSSPFGGPFGGMRPPR